MIRKLLTAVVAAASLSVPALADPDTKGFGTMDSLGCMMMRECTNGVTEIKSVDDLRERFPDASYDYAETEANALIVELNRMGVGVYLSSKDYFPASHAGVYYTVGNNFFLNERYAQDEMQMLQTLRHEGWHAAQDAMAGTIDNSQIAIIYPEEAVPRPFVLQADIAYSSMPHVLPWEREAKWAGGTPGMTLEVLRIINRTDGQPWEEIEPTPLTRLWLERNGFL